MLAATGIEDPLVITATLGAAVVGAVVGLAMWTRARRSPLRAIELARQLFPSLTRAATTAEGVVLGRTLRLAPASGALAIEAPVAVPPLAYDLAARALGRGELLAAFVNLRVTWLPTGFAVRIAPPFPATLVRARIEDAARLATALEALPMADAMARWTLDESTGGQRLTALERLLAAFPDHPETHQVCRLLAGEHMEDAAAARAREHLERLDPRRPHGAI